MCVLCGMPTNALIGKLSFLAHYLLLCGIFKGNVRIICLLASRICWLRFKEECKSSLPNVFLHTHTRTQIHIYIHNNIININNNSIYKNILVSVLPI